MCIYKCVWCVSKKSYCFIINSKLPTLRASPKDYKFYSSNIYLLTYVANKRVKKYDILQKTLQIKIT